MKGRDPLSCAIPKLFLGTEEDSWLQRYNPASRGWNNTIAGGKFSISKVYKTLQGVCVKVP